MPVGCVAAITALDFQIFVMQPSLRWDRALIGISHSSVSSNCRWQVYLKILYNRAEYQVGRNCFTIDAGRNQIRQRVQFGWPEGIQIKDGGRSKLHAWNHILEMLMAHFKVLFVGFTAFSSSHNESFQ